MLITKFNKMIRNRIVWAALVFIISISFVWYFQPSKDQDSSNDRVEGRVYGQDVSPEEFNRARFFALGMRDKSGLSPELNKTLRNITWKRIAELKLAQQLGLIASSKEVGSIIQKSKSFTVNGVFDKEKYKATILNQFGSLEIYETFLAEEITLQKLVNSLEASVWVSPYELTRKLANLTDSFSVEYVTMNTSDYAGKVKVAKKDAENFFNEHKDMFTIPPKVSVGYVEFSVYDYWTNITQDSVSEFDISKYYDDNKELYVKIDTNDEAETVPMSLDESKSEILSILKRDRAVRKAKDAATEFVIALTPDRQGRADDWNSIVKAYGLTSRTTDYFSVTEKVPNLNVESNFNIAAFKLDAGNPERYFSDAIIGEDYVYVICASDAKDSRVPDFEEVVDQVMPYARRQAEEDALIEHAKQARVSIEKALAEKKSFAKIASDLSLTVMTTGVFTVYGMLNDEESGYADVLIPGVISLKAGELTEPLEMEDGVMLAYVADREAGDNATIQLLKPQVIASLDRYRSGVLLDKWSDTVLDEANFEDVTQKRIAEQADMDSDSGPMDSDENSSNSIPPDAE